MTWRMYLPYSDTRFVRFPSSFGTDPDNALMPKLLVCSRQSLRFYVKQNNGGNVVSSKSHMYCIAVNSPRNGGKGPVK